MFRGEPAIPGLDWTFTPRRGSWERFEHQHPFGPPRRFRTASPCPRLDRPASGRAPLTPRALTRRPSPQKRLRACRFRYGSGDYPLSLANGAHSLARSSKRTLGHRSTPLVLPPRDGFLRGASTLSCPSLLSPPGFRLFSPPVLGCFSAFPHGTSALSDSGRI